MSSTVGNHNPGAGELGGSDEDPEVPLGFQQRVHIRQVPHPHAGVPGLTLRRLLDPGQASETRRRGAGETRRPTACKLSIMLKLSWSPCHLVSLSQLPTSLL